MDCSWFIGNVAVAVAVAEATGKVLLVVLCAHSVVRTTWAPSVDNVVVVEGFQGRASFGPRTRAGKASWARPRHE